MEELEKASGLRLWDTGTPRGSCSSSHALLGYLRMFACPTHWLHICLYFCILLLDLWS